MPISTPVAELFASLGIDTRDFEVGLSRAKRDFSLMAVEARASIQNVQRALKDYGGTVEGLAALGRVDIFKDAAKNVEAYGARLREVTRLDQEFQRAIRNREIVIQQAANTERRIDREAAAMDRSMAAQRRADEQQLSAQFSRAMRTRDRTFAQEQPAQGQGQGGGGLGAVGGIARRMALYAAVYGAGRFAASSINRVADLERQGEQTGLGFEGAQRLQLAANITNTPAETMATSISHLQRVVEAMAPATQKVFDKMGMNAVQFKRTLETSTEAGLTEIIKKIQELGSVSERNAAFMQLFGGRSAKDIEALEKMVSLHRESSRITNEEAAQIQRLRAGWAGATVAAQDYFAKLLAAGVRAIAGLPDRPRVQQEETPGWKYSSKSLGRSTAGYGKPYRGDIDLPMSGVPVGPNEADATSPENIQSALSTFSGTRFGAGIGRINKQFEDVARGRRIGLVSEAEFREAEAGRQRLIAQERERERSQVDAIMQPLHPEGISNILSLQKRMREAQELQREGYFGKGGLNRQNVTVGGRSVETISGGGPDPLSGIQKGYQDLINKEMLKEQRRQLEEVKGLLNEFGVEGAASSQLLAIDFQKVTDAFKEGKVSMQELKEATSGYFEMLDEKAAGPGFHRAVMMFSQGLMDKEGLFRAMSIAQSTQKVSGLEGEALKGEPGALQGLMDEIQNRRRMIYAPQRPNRSFDILSPSSGSSVPSMSGKPQASSDIGGTINIIPLDQFSDMQIRRWKQQGLVAG